MTFDMRTLGAWTCNNLRCRLRVTGYLEEMPAGWIVVEPAPTEWKSAIQHLCAVCAKTLDATQNTSNLPP